MQCHRSIRRRAVLDRARVRWWLIVRLNYTLRLYLFSLRIPRAIIARTEKMKSYSAWPRQPGVDCNFLPLQWSADLHCKRVIAAKL